MAQCDFFEQTVNLHNCEKIKYVWDHGIEDICLDY